MRITGLLALLAAVVVMWPLLRHTLENDGHRLIDLEVYRAAGRSVLDGRAVYEFRTPQDLLFTYPPMAAWLSIPFTLLPSAAAAVVWTVANVLVLAGLVAWAFRPLWRRFGALRTAAVLPLAVAGLLWTYPFRDNLVLGQVNLFLLTLVLLDCMPARTRWPRGALVGLATAVKLTPGLFIPYLWLSGRRRAAYTAASVFAGLAAVTWLVLPGDSSQFWLHDMRNPQRLGINWYTTNQSIRGLVLHLHWHGLLFGVAVVALSVLALVLVLRRAPALSRNGDELAALTVVGLGTNLLSPVTWIHHMVWLLLAVAVLVHDGRRPWRALLGLALVAVIAWRTPYFGARIWHDFEGPLDFAGRLVQNCFTVAAFAVVAWLPARAPAPDRVDRGGREGLAREPAYGGRT